MEPQGRHSTHNDPGRETPDTSSECMGPYWKREGKKRDKKVLAVFGQVKSGKVSKDTRKRSGQQKEVKPSGRRILSDNSAQHASEYHSRRAMSRYAP